MMVAGHSGIVTAAAGMAVGLSLILFACAPATTAPAGGAINGTVTYLQRIALDPASTEILVQLIDGSDPAMSAVAETRFTPEAQVPIPFSVAYEGSTIQRDHYYYLRASILDKSSGQIRFATTDDVPVIPGALNSVELVLEPAGQAAAP